MKGAIIGDIVGSIFEHNNIKSKLFPFFGPGCRFTDDTVSHRNKKEHGGAECNQAFFCSCPH